MKKIIILTIAIILFAINLGYSQKRDSTKKTFLKKISKTQFLHIGIRPYFAYTSMGFWASDDNPDYSNEENYAYYFSNEKNETIEFSVSSFSDKISYIPYPDIYIRYEIGNNFFLQADIFGLWFKNEATFKNSVDISEYSQTFNPDGNFNNLGYNKIELQWVFMGNSLSAGLSFLKNKAFRPYIYGGLSSFYLMSFTPGDYYQMRDYRNEIIFSYLDTFKKITFYFHWGLGIKYRGIAVDSFSNYSIFFMDTNDFNDKHENYMDLITYNISISINLFSFNLNKNLLQTK